jgi:hypothetical protein
VILVTGPPAAQFGLPLPHSLTNSDPQYSPGISIEVESPLGSRGSCSALNAFSPTSAALDHERPARRPISLAASPRAPPSPLSESLWAPETDDTYESSILAASPSVQSISFPKPQDISFDTSILRPTASAYISQELSRLSTIDESPSSESPSVIPSSSSSPSLTPTAIVSVSVSASSPSLPPTVRSPLLQVQSSTTVVKPSLSPRPTSVVLTRTPSIVSTTLHRFDSFFHLHEY